MKAIVFQPENPEEMQVWVAERIATGSPFHISARNRAADNLDVLSTSHLQAEQFFEPDDMVIGVETGVPMVQLQERLAAKGMTLPVSPWFADDTVGQMVAANRFGPERMDRGGIRDWIIGISYVNGFGKLVKAGGRVVKNVTGYDVGKLMVGSRGGFGPIATVNFKMMPLPVNPLGLYCGLGTHHWLKWLAEDVLAKRLPLDWVQAVHRKGAWRIGMGISGNEARRERLITELQRAFDHQLHQADEDREPSEYSMFSPETRQKGFLSPTLPNDGEARFHLHGVVPTGPLIGRPRLMECLTGMDATLILHPVGGDFHLVGRLESLTEEKLDRLRRHLTGTGGYLTQEQTSPKLLESFGYSIPLPSEYPLMQRMKQTLDPAGVFHAPFYKMV